MKNLVKEKLKAGKPSVGTWVEMANPDIAEQLAAMGFDWFVFDVEHGVFTFPDVQKMMQAMSAYPDCMPMVRVPWNDPVWFKWALDVGATGVVVPLVNTKEEALNAVRSCKYPPEGIRGCGPRRASKYYTKHEEYVNIANDEILVVVMIETQRALDNLENILSVKGVDATFIGPDDLSLNLGIFLQKQHPKFKAALQKVLDGCKKHGVAPGMHCNEKNISEAIAQGFQFCALNDDDTFLQMGAQTCLVKRSKAGHIRTMRCEKLEASRVHTFQSIPTAIPIQLQPRKNTSKFGLTLITPNHTQTQGLNEPKVKYFAFTVILNRVVLQVLQNLRRKNLKSFKSCFRSNFYPGFKI